LIDIVPTLLDFCDVAIPSDIQGRSLAPILLGERAPTHHRDFVRCEYYNALPSRGQAAYGSMIRNERYKLVVYHGYETGELFDLQLDPGEFENLWDQPQYGEVRFALMKQNFDALAFAVDLGPKRRSESKAEVGHG